MLNKDNSSKDGKDSEGKGIDIPDDKLSELADRILANPEARDKLMNNLGDGLGRRALMAGAGGVLAGMAGMGYAKSGTYITEDNLGTKGAYSAIVYIDGTRVVAEDFKGNIIDFGTKGVDDARVIQSAIDNLPNNGGTVFLKTGIFNIDRSIRVKSNTIMKGEGFLTIIKQSKRNSGNKTIVSNPLDVNLGFGEGANNIKIKDITIDANYTTRTTSYHTIRFTSVDDVKIENVRIKNSGDWCISLSKCRWINTCNIYCDNSHADGVHFADCRYGEMNGVYGRTLDDLASVTAIKEESYHINVANISGIVSEYNLVNIASESENSLLHDVNVVNVTGSSPNKALIQIFDHKDAYRVYRVNVSNVTGMDSLYSIFLSYVYDVNISNIHGSGVFSWGVYCRNSDKVMINNLNIEGYGDGGVLFEGVCNDIKLVNATIKNSNGEHGVILADSTGATFTNIFTDTGNKYGFFIGKSNTTTNNLRITDCRCKTTIEGIHLRGYLNNSMINDNDLSESKGILKGKNCKFTNVSINNNLGNN